MKKNLNILQINSSDIRGGAASVAWRLHNSYLKENIVSKFAARYKFSSDQNVIIIENDKQRNLWFQFFFFCSNVIEKFSWTISRFLLQIANPKLYFYKQQGKEYFDFKGFEKILQVVNPNIIHAHVLHGDYFDLEFLSKISNKIPVIITMHDAWLLSGHCAHSFDCEKWKTGCGNCPDLTIRPAIKKDATAFNWNQKKEFYKNSKFVIVTPCQWLMNKFDDSMLKTNMRFQKVIPNGIDLNLFKPANKSDIRIDLGIPQNIKVILFASNGIKNNIWKDFETLKKALMIVSKKTNQEILFLAIGEKSEPLFYENCKLESRPFIYSEIEMSKYFQAVDLYIHAANADTFPTTILEALACGLPIVATAVGGIPEQVKGLKNSVVMNCEDNRFDTNEATGILVNKKDSESMAQAVFEILFNDDLSQKLALNARKDAEKRFDLEHQKNQYLEIYNQFI
jgi:glycosyltransferase involved in cell wall biosynthesis